VSMGHDKPKKSKRNKTIELDSSEQRLYLNRCVSWPVTQENHPDGAADHPPYNRTILGDMLQVCAALPQHSVDLLIADPPYNLRKDYHGHSFSKMSSEDYMRYTEEWLSACLPLLKPTASLYVCCDWRSSLVVGQVLQEMAVVRNRITWQREKGRGAKKNWKNGMEDIWFATISDDYLFNLDAVRLRRKVRAPYRKDGKPKDWIEADRGSRYRDTCPSNFWDDITVPFWSMAENTAHPTQKSEKLIARLMLASSAPDDLVLDPFLGSGTTSVVAKKLGRRYWGIERNEVYCAWAEKRLEMARIDAQIQGFEDGVFWERNSR
jgi:site-specific DNA-methyltransferase (adenine-specific)